MTARNCRRSIELRATAIDDHAAFALAMKALDKLILSSEPKLLVWDATAVRIRTVSIDTAYADQMRDSPTCLGTYDFDARVEYIVDDLKAVWGVYR